MDMQGRDALDWALPPIKWQSCWFAACARLYYPPMASLLLGIGLNFDLFSCSGGCGCRQEKIGELKAQVIVSDAAH